MNYKTYIESRDGTVVPPTLVPQIRKGIRSIFYDHQIAFTSISIVTMNDESLLEINKNFLSHDYYTDIITFSYEEDDSPVEGELLISIDRVKENALDLRVEYLHELLRVIFHGILHLVGYNDVTVNEKEEMRTKETYYINLVLSKNSST